MPNSQLDLEMECSRVVASSSSSGCQKHYLGRHQDQPSGGAWQGPTSGSRGGDRCCSAGVKDMGCSSSRGGCVDGGKCAHRQQRSTPQACVAMMPPPEPEPEPEPWSLGGVELHALASLDDEQARKQFFRSPLGRELGKAIVDDNTWDFESTWNSNALRQVPGVAQLVAAVAREHRSWKVLRYLEGVGDSCDALPPSPTPSATGSDISSLTEPESTRPLSAGCRRRASTKERKRRWSKRQLAQQASVKDGAEQVRQTLETQAKSSKEDGSRAAAEEGSGPWIVSSV